MWGVNMALYTQDRLAETLKALILEKSLDSITVRELVARAKINRKTFYYHFHSIADLIEWMYGTEFAALVDSKEITPITWMDIFSEVTGRMRQEESYLRAAFSSQYGSGLRMALMRYFDRTAAKFVRSAIDMYEAEHDVKLYLTQKQFNYINHYYSMAFYGMVEQWFRDGMKDSEAEFAHIMKQLSHDNMFRTFAMMQEENMDAQE